MCKPNENKRTFPIFGERRSASQVFGLMKLHHCGVGHEVSSPFVDRSDLDQVSRELLSEAFDLACDELRRRGVQIAKVPRFEDVLSEVLISLHKAGPVGVHQLARLRGLPRQTYHHRSEP